MKDTAKSDLILGNQDKSGAKAEVRAHRQRKVSPRSCCVLTTNDWQMPPAFVAVDFKNHRITGLTIHTDLRLRTRRSAWPTWSCFHSWLLVGSGMREVDFIRRLAAKRVVGTVLVVPVDDEANLVLEIRPTRASFSCVELRQPRRRKLFGEFSLRFLWDDAA